MSQRITSSSPACPVAIESINDPRLSEFADIRNRPTGKASSESHFVVEGAKIVERLIDSRYRVRTILVQEGRPMDWLDRLDGETKVYVLSGEQISGLAGFHFHRGYFASASRIAPRGIDAFRPDRVSLAFVRISDMENMGSMIRSAAAFGIRQILVDQHSIDPFSRRVIRVSMGAVLAMEFFSMDDPADAFTELDRLGIRSFATSLSEDSKPIHKIDSGREPRLIAMGNERDGLPMDVQQAASERVMIPMARHAASGELIDSLNVSVAAAIVMHELTPRSE